VNQIAYRISHKLWVSAKSLYVTMLVVLSNSLITAPTESVMIQNDESGELSLTAGPQTIFCTAKGGSRPTMSMKLGDDAPIAM